MLSLHTEERKSGELITSIGPLQYLQYDDVIMSAIASQITSLTIVYSTVYPGADESKHQSSASLAFVRRIHRGPVNSPHKWPVTRKMFLFDDVIMFHGCIRMFYRELAGYSWLGREIGLLIHMQTAARDVFLSFDLLSHVFGKLYLCIFMCPGNNSVRKSQ